MNVSIPACFPIVTRTLVGHGAPEPPSSMRAGWQSRRPCRHHRSWAQDKSQEESWNTPDKTLQFDLMSSSG
jgi:hypothetical protein